MGDRVTQLRKWATEQRKHHNPHTADFYEETADEIERLHAERDTAFLAGVKAGLDAGLNVIENCGCPCSGCHDAISAIDPATIKPVTEKSHDV